MGINLETLRSYNLGNEWLYAQNGSFFVATDFRDKFWVIIADLFSWGRVTQETQELFNQTIDQADRDITPIPIGEEALKNWFETNTSRIAILNEVQEKSFAIHFFSQVKVTKQASRIEVLMKQAMLADLSKLSSLSYYNEQSALPDIRKRYEYVMAAYSYNFNRMSDGALERIRTGPWKATIIDKTCSTNSIPKTTFHVKYLHLHFDPFRYIDYGLEEHFDEDLKVLQKDLESIPPHKRIPITMHFWTPPYFHIREKEKREKAQKIVEKVVKFVTDRPDLFVHHFSTFALLRKQRIPIEERIFLLSHVCDEKPQGILKSVTNGNSHTALMPPLSQSVIEEAKRCLPDCYKNSIDEQSKPFSVVSLTKDNKPHIGQLLLNTEEGKDFTLTLGNQQVKVHKKVICEAFPWIEAKIRWEGSDQNKCSLDSFYNLDEVNIAEQVYLLDSLSTYAYTRENPTMLRKGTTQAELYCDTLDVLCASQQTAMIR